MFNHIMIGSNDIEKSKAFYTAVLGVLGAGEPMVNVSDGGHTRLFFIHDGSSFAISEPINGELCAPSNGATIGFKCGSAEKVVELHDVAIANGGTSIEDPPGPRSNSLGTMHLSYFRDPDGHKICGVHMGA